MAPSTTTPRLVCVAVFHILAALRAEAGCTGGACEVVDEAAWLMQLGRSRTVLNSTESCAKNDEEYTMELPTFSKSITVPTVPADLGFFAYATANALVGVPPKCYEAYKAELGPEAAAPNDADREGGATGMYYFRISDPEKEYAILAKMVAGCACGLVVTMHGSSGARWGSVIYTKWFSGAGYVVVMPDSMAANNSLKGADTLLSTSEMDVSDYWCAKDAYAGVCKSFSKPFCYSTKADNIVNDGPKYQEFVERNYLIRKRELDYFFANAGGSLLGAVKTGGKVLLVGRSEGGLMAARYHNAALDSKLSGRIIDAWSCEYNYFTGCPDAANVCQDECDKSVPVLNVVGASDQYFGATSSVSTDVASRPGGYGASLLTGNCRQKFDSQGFEKSTVVMLEGARHDETLVHDNLIRSLFLTFADDPANMAVESVEPRCTLADGVYTCPEDPETERTWSSCYGSDVVTSWKYSGPEPCDSTASSS